MKFVKKNIKFIIGLIVGVMLAGGIVYAVTTASEITYTREGRNDIKSVADALNDLYTKTSNLENYDNKSYTQEGLSIYENRVTIVDGGYYTDNNGTTWVNLTLKTNKALSGNDSWLLIYGLPTVDSQFVVTNTQKNYTFTVRNSYVGDTVRSNRIEFMDHSNTSLPSDITIVLQFKY